MRGRKTAGDPPTGGHMGTSKVNIEVSSAALLLLTHPQPNFLSHFRSLAT